MNSSYQASHLIKWLHGINRYGQPSNLSVSFTDAPSTHYFEDYGMGVGYSAAAFVAFGILIFLITSIMYCGACCRCCWGWSTRLLPSQAKSRIKIYSILITIAVVAMVAAAIHAAVMVPKTISGITGILDLPKHVTDAVDPIVEDLGSIQMHLSSVDNNLYTLEGQVPASYYNQLEDVRDLAQQGSSSAGDARNTLSDAESEIRNHDINYQKYKTMGLQIGIAFVCLSAVWALLVVSQLAPCICAMHFLRFLLLVGIVSTLFVWLFTALLFALSVGMSDVCVDPEAMVMAQASGSVTPNDIRYFTTCDVDSGAGTSDVSQAVEDAKQQLTEALSEFAGIDFNGASPQAMATRDAIIADLTATVDSASDIVTEVSCNLFNSIWRSVRSSICVKFSNGIIGLWVSYTIYSIFASLILFFGAPFWHNHIAIQNRLEKQKRSLSAFITSDAGGGVQDMRSPLYSPGSPLHAEPTTGYQPASSPSAAPQVFTGVYPGAQAAPSQGYSPYPTAQPAAGYSPYPTAPSAPADGGYAKTSTWQ